MVQLHKKFTNDQIQTLFKRYLKHEIERKYVQEILGIRKARFFALLKDYRKNPEIGDDLKYSNNFRFLTQKCSKRK
jgi:hypothetical protein